MAYIGVSPSNGVRRKHTYTATANQTSFSGAGAEGATLSYNDSNFVDVYQNGVKLSEADYTSTSGTAIVLATGATVSDMVEIVVYDVFSVADTVSKSAGGTFDADVTFADGADIITASAGNNNTRIGVNAGNSITSNGNENVLVGDEAGTALTTGDDNVAIGYRALSTEDTGTRSVAIGHDALRVQNNDSTNYNTAVGFGAGEAVTTGIQNTLIGGLAGDALNDADYNVAIGTSALGADTLGSRAVAIGRNALIAQNFTSATNNYNVAVGYSAGGAITTGVNNTLIGGLAGDALDDADHNVAIGYLALSADTLGSRSVAIGFATLDAQNFTSATDAYNVAIGYTAGGAVTTGQFNVIVGGLAGDALTHSGANTFIGHNSGGAYNGADANTFNTFIGTDSGSAMTTGTKNTILGSYDGNEGGLDIRTVSNTIVLSDGDGNPRIANDGTKTAIGSPTSAKTSTGTIEIKGTSANQSIITNSDNSGSYANGATLDFGNRSGVMIINNWNNGNVELFACGGGAISRFAGTGTGAGAIAFTSGVYRWTNDTGSTNTFTHTFIQTRNDA